VTRTRNLIGTALVPYRTIQGTASAGSDFSEDGGVLTFLNGESSKTLQIAIINDAE